VSRSKTWSHLLGLPRRIRGAKSDDDDAPVVDDYNNDDPLDEQYAEEEDDDKKPRGKKAKRAEDDDDKPDAEDDDADADDDDDDKKPSARARGKKAKRAEDGDDKPDAEDDEDDDKKPSAARASERERCARIMAYGMNHGMGQQAFALAFDSNISRATAVSVLKANKAFAPKQAPAAGQTFGQAMAGLNVHQVAPDGSRERPAGVDAAAAMIIKAGQ